MKTVVTKGIVLARTNFQEADRIVTLLTPDHGKLRLLAKGVRKSRSKMAGGIELFSVGDITFLPGKGELGTLISSRLQIHYGNIVKDINRTMFGYEILKRVNKITEEAAESAYFELLQKSLAGLNDLDLSVELSDLWLSMQLLKTTGHAPNLRTDTAGNKLEEGKAYVFSFDDMAFSCVPHGDSSARLVKLLRLAYSAATPGLLGQVKDAVQIAPEALKLTKNMNRLHLAA